ncbi:MAG: DUF6922 domain-containing protein [Caldisericaceae bacterium]
MNMMVNKYRGINMEMPEYVRTVLWDVDPGAIDLKRHWFFVIERIMVYGNENDVQWMLGTFSKEQLIEVVKKSRNLNWKTANFWALHFDIDKRKIRCFKNTFIIREGLK